MRTVSPTDYVDRNRDRFLNGLKEFLAIPSISTLPEHTGDVLKAAEFVAHELESMGMSEVEIIKSDKRHPLVYAQWMEAKVDAPTILIYGHYDVQPADPLNEWISGPFEPTVRENKIYARGATDDKGQLYIVLKALHSYFATYGYLPVNVKMLLEGEEESGGKHISEFVLQELNKDKLKADAVLICDTAMFELGWPKIITGLRGIVYAEIKCQGPDRDLHSGVYGGVAPNPLNALAQIIAGLKTSKGHIRIPKFYDQVVSPSQAELTSWASLAFDENKLLREEIGAKSLIGDRRISALQRMWAKPTLDVHGIIGGFTGEGAKTVIPACAKAKISMRLVPNMDPDEIADLLKAHVAKLTPEGISSEVEILHSAPAVLVDTNNRFVSEASFALNMIFGKKTLFTREGGTIPIAGLFAAKLKTPVVLMGFGLPDDRMHSPNEKFDLDNFFNGMKTVIYYLERLGRQ
jgi:acetylornithine deacetylase/succinyl-diaminopimelate desuccinylase-like protein